MKFLKSIYPVLVLSLICLIISGLLSFTNEITKEPIAKISEETASKLRVQVLPNSENFQKNDTYYIGLDKSNNINGYVFTNKAKGYGGEITVMVGINTNEEITGVAILSHSETPGLGANCINTSFTDEFNQKIRKDGFKIVKDKSGGNNGKIDAITGATITSNAVNNAVNLAIEDYYEISINK